MLRVIITDDHPVVLKGLKEIISDGFDNVTIDVCTRGYEFLIFRSPTSMAWKSSRKLKKGNENCTFLS
jgi:hypothetical protein